MSLGFRTLRKLTAGSTTTTQLTDQQSKTAAARSTAVDIAGYFTVPWDSKLRTHATRLVNEYRANNCRSVEPRTPVRATQFRNCPTCGLVDEREMISTAAEGDVVHEKCGTVTVACRLDEGAVFRTFAGEVDLNHNRRIVNSKVTQCRFTLQRCPYLSRQAMDIALEILVHDLHIDIHYIALQTGTTAIRQRHRTITNYQFAVAAVAANEIAGTAPASVSAVRCTKCSFTCTSQSVLRTHIKLKHRANQRRAPKKRKRPDTLWNPCE